MTTRAFFDKGIYKNTLKRFTLGSVLYFILLFVCTGMLLMLCYEPHYYDIGQHYAREEMFFPAMMIAFFVPTVVALLVYRFVHSKKNGIFTHSLPVTRTANYISTLLGAFTLMAVPVILNGIILYILSLCGYGYYFEVGSVGAWILLNLTILFVMFSVSTFSAICTGNSFAMIVINAMLLFVPLLIATITETILYEFLFGYSYKRNLLDFAGEINPVIFLGEFTDNLCCGDEFDAAALIGFLAMAVALYVLSGFIYKLRHTETGEEVAGFKVLNPVFKYFIAFLGTLSAFALFSQFMGEKPVLFTFMVVLASIIFYFGCEMLLKKTVKVWKSYKGYLAFGGVFTVFILFLALTSVFGYETYVPEFEDVEEVAIYNYYYQSEEPFTGNEELSKYIIELHKWLVKKENRSILNHYDYQDTRIHITYKLKDGRIITRRYGVDNKTKDEVMTKAYKYEDYKRACEAVFDERIEKINSVDIGKYEIVENEEKLNELIDAMKMDILELDYDKLHLGGKGVHASIRFITDKETRTMVAVDSGVPLYTGWMEVYVTEHFNNTFNWLKENEYEHVAEDVLSGVYHGDKVLTSW